MIGQLSYLLTYFTRQLGSVMTAAEQEAVLNVVAEAQSRASAEQADAEQVYMCMYLSMYVSVCNI